MVEYKDKKSFDDFFRELYVPVDYKSIRVEMRDVAQDGWNLFTEEYRERHRIQKKDYILYMTSDAYCTFEEIVENAIDMLNAPIADAVLEISNAFDYDSSITEIYFDTTEQLLKEMLDCLYDDVLVYL